MDFLDCYIITLSLQHLFVKTVIYGMTHHHHHPGHAHPTAQIGPSILRMSAPQRLVYAGALIALLWAAVFWALA
jgi:hypothetical protein